MITIPQLSEAMKVIGRSLPVSMEIWFGRDDGDSRVKMEIGDGEKVTTYAFLDCLPLPAFPLGLLQRESQLEKALCDLLATIELHTDCMTGQIDRESLGPYIEIAEALITGPVVSNDDQEWLS